MTLLPPNATPIERAIEQATARIEDIDAPFDTLVNPATIDAAWLPWLAFGLSVDSWNADWSVSEKRAAVAGSIALHRIKGTRLSVERVLARFDHLAHIVEWHEAHPAAAPHTFEVILPIAGPGIEPGGKRSTAQFAEAIVSEVAQMKPLREHFQLLQQIACGARVGLIAGAMVMLAHRDNMALREDHTQPWELLLQTEDGEPLNDVPSFLEHAPTAISLLLETEDLDPLHGGSDETLEIAAL